MELGLDVPREFRTLRGRAGQTRAIVVCDGLVRFVAGALLERVAIVGWQDLYHAYGPAQDVSAQLAAVIVGDDATTRGLVEPRRQHPSAGHDLRGHRARRAGACSMLDAAAQLLRGWRREPAPAQRALLWLLSVLPELRAQHAPLVAEVLPERHRDAWNNEVTGGGGSQEEENAVFALTDWIYGGAEH